MLLHFPVHSLLTMLHNVESIAITGGTPATLCVYHDSFTVSHLPLWHQLVYGLKI